MSTARNASGALHELCCRRGIVNKFRTTKWCCCLYCCRCSAAAPIYVDIEYTRGREIVTRKGPGQAVRIGRMPLMLRCDK